MPKHRPLPLELNAVSRNIVETKKGYAIGKIGKTAQYMMYYQMLLSKEKNRAKLKEFEKGLEFNCLKQQGIFPVNNGFYLRYNQFYSQHVKNIDCLGICYIPRELEIIKYYQLMSNNLIFYPDQEPDRSSPSNDNNCYLQYFNNKKILIICPFADLLKERAAREIFEGVWSKTGKKWFYPKKIDSLEFPYGFSSETHKMFPTAIDLFEYITSQIDRKDFDIALIGAAGLAIPLASYVKNIGKIGIDLGGALQFFFGVLGKRWRNWPTWNEIYYNEYWIDMPSRYIPKETGVCDNGAYW
jgi:hypothetical protein